MKANLNLLCLGPQANLDNTIIESVRELYGQGERLDAIVAFGGEVPDALLLECYEQDSQPLVLLVPGAGDLQQDTAGRLVEQALVKNWRDTETDLWNGAYSEIVDAMRDRVFKDFLDRARDYPVEAWQPGLLPGEGSIRITVGDRRVGLVVANTVFRMVTSPPDHALVACATEQLSHSAGGDYEAWQAENDLTVVVAAEPAALPFGFPLNGSTLLLAGRQGRDDAWRDVGRQYRLIRVRFGPGGRPELTDATEDKRITLIQRAPVHVSISEPLVEEQYDGAVRLRDFYQQAESGRMVLVLVSGAMNDTIDLDELREQITVRTYGNLPSSKPSMRSIWPVAVDSLSRPQLRSILDQLRIAPDIQLPGVRNLLRCPWWRIYDFTGTDTLKTVASTDAQISERVFDACHDRPDEDPAVDVEIVAMNGIFGDDPANVDFGPPSDHASPRSQWFRQFQADALLYPMVWMAASPSSQALWELMELIATQKSEVLPARFVVTTNGPLADRARLRRNGLIHIRRDPADFASTNLRPGIEQLRIGRERRKALVSGMRRGKGVSLVAALIKNRPTGNTDYLKGHDPTWGDIVDGKAAKLSVVDAIRRAGLPGVNKVQPIVLVKGRAGAGKTTALMHFAYSLYRKGKTVGWIDRETSRSRKVVVDEVLELSPDVMFVDDVSIFSGQAATLLRHLNRNGQTLVVASVRRTREDVIDASFHPRVVAADDPLDDGDLEKLAKILKDNGLLGILKPYRFARQRVNKLRELSGRSLLAAMIEVVTGERFEDKVRSEYEQLSDDRKLIYATVSFLQSELINKQHDIDEGDLIQVVSPGELRVETLHAINALESQRLLNRTPNGSLRCRQKTFADTVVDSILKDQSEFLGKIIRSLLIFYAERGGHIRQHDHPYRMVMIRLLSHEMMKKARIPYDAVHSIYDSVHDLLHEDFHYWLQRGQFELERGDLSIAANYVNSAAGCIGGAVDHLVQTTSSSIRIQQATRYPKDAESPTKARAALDNLERIARRKGSDSPHTFAVMVRDGFKWMKACQSVVSKDEFLDLRNQILDICQLGKEVCKNNNKFLDIAENYEPKIRRLMSVPM